MKKLLALFFGLGFLSQQAFAVTVMGEEFAGYVDTLVSKSSGVWMDLGTTPPPGTADVSYNLADVDASITDLDADTWIGGFYNKDTTQGRDFVDLAFNVGVVNGNGIDLKIFFVGGNGQNIELTINGETVQYLLGSNEGLIPGALDSVYPGGLYPVGALGINLDDFKLLTGPVTQFRLTVGDRWSGPSVSSLPSFVGAYNVVPVPAAVWLFGSGLLGLAGVARRKK